MITSLSSLALLGHYVNQQGNHGDTVRVFDGDGNLEQVYDLNAAVLGITVDAAEGTLYATRRFPNLEITRYRLPFSLWHPDSFVPLLVNRAKRCPIGRSRADRLRWIGRVSVESEAVFLCCRTC